MTKRHETSKVQQELRGCTSFLVLDLIKMFFSRKKKQQPVVTRNPKMAAAAEPSFIGRNCVFEGHITCDGELHIDGTIRGTVQAGLCVVDEAGVIHGTVTGQIVHVRGRVLGPIQGSTVVIHAGAHVEGDVFNDTISIENGAYVYGSIRHNAAPAPIPAAKQIFAPLEEAKPVNNNAAGELRVVSNRK
jgi:cytoskeletal protein CcmA (bactofilin family)